MGPSWVRFPRATGEPNPTARLAISGVNRSARAKTATPYGVNGVDRIGHTEGTPQWDFIYALDGVSRAPGNLKVEFRNEEGTIEFTPAAIHIDGRLDVS